MSHYLDIVIRDGALAAELHGRLLWIVHQLRSASEPHHIGVDFPGYHSHGMGFSFRAFAEPMALARIVAMATKLEDIGLIGIQSIRPVPENVTEYVVCSRLAKGDSRKYSPSRLQRYARRAIARGEAPPDLPQTATGGIRAENQYPHPRQFVVMASQSSSSPENYTLAISRTPARSSDNATVGPGAAYGLGIPVPLVSERLKAGPDATRGAHE
ncbi:type I-F CRISPR-associated endoribonuclease Cas6/Csy4 [Vreelandella rituensis]|uniref:Type I-F CRISPR-associated endoribonuclease Cas6/Csy4 n=1 Tax=Vreelandella rituensis TaxID=2282306 RepID=A0A368UB28_9GAMM|nr:type I-F CRISPR-associated endoribonuclease Cas6/Csy4 [Halomonas rituensis]RCV93767.1 type I-F CRISPR-associated endoribonuclease Cas6/Csy4 [Halomonas rituensis]